MSHKIKVTTQTRIDNKYSLYAAENKLGYLKGELIKVTENKPKARHNQKVPFTIIKVEPKQQHNIL